MGIEIASGGKRIVLRCDMCTSLPCIAKFLAATTATIVGRQMEQ